MNTTAKKRRIRQYAAAGAAFDLCADAALLKRAKAEFSKRTRGFTYDPLVARRQKPPTANP